ncbi:hypothetical protein HanRHA438_Chr10g0432221 [Helianthus annuus]|nr:hypothetical protein HanRHA438_Chr10g0432221 [Helianthus annuus]
MPFKITNQVKHVKNNASESNNIFTKNEPPCSNIYIELIKFKMLLPKIGQS